MMPLEYRGKRKNCGGYTSTMPREWTEKEIEWLEQMIADGFSVGEIAESMGRSETIISIKKKRLTKSNRTYNSQHIDEKYTINQQFLNVIEPKTVLDLYCGTEHFYNDKNLIVTTNDLDEGIDADFHSDAFRLICSLYGEGQRFDMIDLDPFGSAYDCFDLAIKMADKGLAITLGELGHKRWKRLDFVRSHYGIESIEDFTI